MVFFPATAVQAPRGQPWLSISSLPADGNIGKQRIIAVQSIAGFHEPANCLSHLAAAIVLAVVGVYFVRQGRGNWCRWISLLIMAVSSVFLLSMSAVYHMLGPGAGRDVMRQLDIAGVFTLIAGTFTPVHVILFTGWRRWLPLVLVWSAAVTGITWTAVFSDSLPWGVETTCFLILGWAGVPSWIDLWRRFGFAFIRPLVWGGIAYTMGVVFLAADRPVLLSRVVGPHEIWHVAVLAGLGLHWKFVFQIAAGYPRRAAESGGR
jgi:channel protein (hemolysin III family)